MSPALFHLKTLRNKETPLSFFLPPFLPSFLLLHFRTRFSHEITCFSIITTQGVTTTLCCTSTFGQRVATVNHFSNSCAVFRVVQVWLLVLFLLKQTSQPSFRAHMDAQAAGKNNQLLSLPTKTTSFRGNLLLFEVTFLEPEHSPPRFACQSETDSGLRPL